ncbi:MAG: hypothetical protein ACTII7_13175 [Galactobacter sp.]
MLPFSILVLFAQQQLGLGELGYGLILSVSALGGLVGSRVAGLLGLADGSALGGVLATVHIALPVLSGGIVFLLCTAAALTLIRDVEAITEESVL